MPAMAPARRRSDRASSARRGSCWPAVAVPRAPVASLPRAKHPSPLHFAASRPLNPQLGDLAVQRAESHAEAAGRFLLVGSLPENALDVLTLEAPRRFTQIVNQGRIVLEGSEVGRQVGRRDQR